MGNSPQWLDVVRHRIRGFRAPYLLILQHHDIPAATLLSAPVTLPFPGDMDILAPRLIVEGSLFRARMLDLSAVPRGLIGGTIASATTETARILDAIDIILHGYPVGRPW